MHIKKAGESMVPLRVDQVYPLAAEPPPAAGNNVPTASVDDFIVDPAPLRTDAEQVAAQRAEAGDESTDVDSLENFLAEQIRQNGYVDEVSAAAGSRLAGMWKDWRPGPVLVVSLTAGPRADEMGCEPRRPMAQGESFHTNDRPTIPRNGDYGSESNRDYVRDYWRCGLQMGYTQRCLRLWHGQLDCRRALRMRPVRRCLFGCIH